MRHKPKKSLGQNFLIDGNIRGKIISSLGLEANNTVVEIGSGRGELTLQIAKKVKQVYALEIDRALCEALAQNLKEYPNIEVRRADILKFDLGSLAEAAGEKLKIFGNIPYYISTPIIERLIKYKDYLGVAFLTLQKEFAERLAAGPGSKRYGSLSLFAQYYFQPQILFCIKKNSFYPAPKVDSCFVQLKPWAKIAVLVNDEERFFSIIRKAFNYRRKTLRNSLSGLVGEEKLNEFFNQFGLDRRVRPEQLSMQDFADLSNIRG